MIVEALAVILEALGGRRKPVAAFSLRAVVAPAGSAAHQEDFSHCWALVNTGVSGGAENVIVKWGRGPDGKPGAALEVGAIPRWKLAPLDGITRPSERPSVWAEVSWTGRDGSRQRSIVSLD